eukprot:scaffold150685_cov39-Prasinocladus_malaysianus.AAC.1
MKKLTRPKTASKRTVRKPKIVAPFVPGLTLSDLILSDLSLVDSTRSNLGQIRPDEVRVGRNLVVEVGED